MNRLKIDTDTLRLSLLMETVAGVRVKDCFKDEETVYFIVGPGQVGKAIGRGGENIHKVQAELNKKVKVIEYRDDAVSFVRNVIYPVKVEEVVEEDGTIVIKDSNRKVKGQLIGRDGRNLEIINRAVKRFFGKDVKIG